ncbi:vWA domain-containing protein [Candidatus Accumulibacter phosphatis]|uniref:vWA domain-containing protein n=1 Tax=Candidatus Accumulibacter phosphatis TaxID=327160 RepID=UPI0020BFC0B0|nr:hypothetical protein [Candidatus Accumulibacter phosphatis]
MDAMDFSAPTLVADGSTPTGAAIRAALKAIQEQKDELKAAGISYKRPILMLMSDGVPSDAWEDAAEACRAAEAANKVTVFFHRSRQWCGLGRTGSFLEQGSKTDFEHSI